MGTQYINWYIMLSRLNRGGGGGGGGGVGIEECRKHSILGTHCRGETENNQEKHREFENFAKTQGI